jgi:ABC-type Fe3+-hydroxamate transport system substrate-binding protein
MKKKLLILFAILVVCAGCASQADVASTNLSKAADQFEIQRKIVFYNGITDTYVAVVEGLCSLGNHDAYGELSVTCKIGPNQYVKHFLGLSDNVTYFCLQLESVPVDPYHHRIIWRPETIIPDIELDTGGDGQ